MKWTVVGAGLALSLATAAHADWLAIGSSVNNSTWYMDPDRIKTISGRVQAWVKIDSRRDRTVQWSETKQLMSFDCSAMTERTLAVVNYDSYGKVVSSQSVPDNGFGIGYDPVVPDSMGETVAKLACRTSNASNQAN